MFDNAKSVPQDIQDFIPHDCVNSPAPGKAFCSVHCDQLRHLNIPTGLREFISFCGASSDTYDKEGKSKVKQKLSMLAKKVRAVEGTSSTEAQGVVSLLRTDGMATREQLQELPGGENCRKDIGEPNRLRRRTRGILPFISGKSAHNFVFTEHCSGGGIIRAWDTLYRSEGATQVGLLKLKFILKLCKNVDPSEWHTYFLSYDQGCRIA